MKKNEQIRNWWKKKVSYSTSRQHISVCSLKMVIGQSRMVQELFKKSIPRTLKNGEKLLYGKLEVSGLLSKPRDFWVKLSGWQFSRKMKQFDLINCPLWYDFSDCWIFFHYLCLCAPFLYHHFNSSCLSICRIRSILKNSWMSSLVHKDIYHLETWLEMLCRVSHRWVIVKGDDGDGVDEILWAACCCCCP